MRNMRLAIDTDSMERDGNRQERAIGNLLDFVIVLVRFKWFRIILKEWN